MIRIIETSLKKRNRYIKQSKNYKKESTEKSYKTKQNAIKIKAIDDSESKGEIIINNESIVKFTFGGAGIDSVNIENSEELVGAFLDMLSDLTSIENEEYNFEQPDDEPIEGEEQPIEGEEELIEGEEELIEEE